ncbi:MAG: hypothetical protein M1820_009200 [Bogoriella megaspora]|nr:MAG: hypothetical protein M1820_009200 [Bogoriella megaspora]
MANKTTYDEMHRLMEELVAKNERLETENAALRGHNRLKDEALDEIESQRNQIYRELVIVRMIKENQKFEPGSNCKPESDSTTSLSCNSENRCSARLSMSSARSSDSGGRRLMQGWLSTPKMRQHLGAIEDLWASQKYTEAFKAIDGLLTREDLDHDVRIEAKLLRASILRDTGKADKALLHAKEALQIALQYDTLYELRGKARFHLGLCLFEQGKFGEAYFAFSCATHTQGHSEEVEKWRKNAEIAIEKISPSKA